MSRPDAASRLRRILTVIPWVLDHQGATVAEVAARFGLTEAELERDLELIPFCGLPPYSPDRLIDCEITDGRVFLRFAEYLSRPLRLTPAEGLTLLAAGRTLTGVAGADPGGSLASALAKLAGVLGDAEGMAIDLGSDRFLGPLRAAATAGERIEIDYYASGRDALTTRKVDPRAVFAGAGAWYVDAWCHSAGDERLFRVDRVRAVRPTGEHFQPGGGRRHTDGTLEAAVEGALFHPAEDDLRVTLLLDPEAAWVVESYPTEAVTHTADGPIRAVLAVGGTAFLERLLLRLGPSARVVEPEGAAAVGAAAARRVLSRYEAEPLRSAPVDVGG